MSGYRDTFKTVGAIRAAAFRMCERLRPDDLASELHDSICRALPEDSDTPVAVARAAADTLAASREAADFLRSFFGPVAHDDPDGWSDEDARSIHQQLCAAIAKAEGRSASAPSRRGAL